MPDRPVLNVSRETTDRLEVYASLLAKWTRSINLIAPRSVPFIWSRHILDSVQVFDVAGVQSGLWADLGSGGGLPGAVIAIIAAERAPGVNVVCVESDQRKSVFLETVSRETGVPFRVVADRIEAVSPLGADIVSARALAPLDSLMRYAALHLAAKGVAVFPKGAQHEKERTDAEKNWRFSCQTFTSCTDPSAVIYKVGAPRRV
jgi:16S rRNA (guanine527-N7)-methyltransferase